MTVWIRRLAIAVGALVLLLVVAAAVLLATFDAGRYKGLAIQWMKAEHQRTLEIDGPVKLSFFPRLSVRVSKVRLSERGRNDQFAAIGEAAFAVRVLPLLRKELVIDRVSARDVDANFVRDARGRSNIDDLVSRNAAARAGGGAAPPAASALQFDVSGVHLDNLNLHVRDQVTGVAGDFSVQSFSSGRLANRAESPVSLRMTAQLTQPEALKVSIDGHATLALDLDRGSFALSRTKVDVTGETPSLKALSLKVDVRRALLNPSDKRLELESLELALAGRRGGEPFEMSIRWPRLAVAGGKLEGSPLSGRIKIAGPDALEGQIRSAAPSGSFDAVRVPGLELTLTGTAGQRKVAGSAKADMLLDTARRAAAIEHLDVRASLTGPGLPPLKLILQGSGSAKARAAATWKLNGSINARRFETSGQAAFAGKLPEIKAVGRFDDLDFNALLPPGKPASNMPGSAAPVDTPLALDGLKTVNGQFTLEAAALAFRQYQVLDAKVVAALDNGVLRVARFSGRAWGGSIQGSGSADANSHRFAVSLDANQVDVNALLKNVADKDLLEGTGHVVANLDASGMSVGALRSSLSGTVALDVRNGAVKGIDLPRALRQARAALSLNQDAISRASGAQKTDFSRLQASARIAGGVAHSDDLDLKSPLLRIGGAGQFDIGRGRIDYTARARLTAAAAGAAGLEALRGVEVPIALSGPFDAIDWKIQWSGVAEAVVRNKLQEKLAESIAGKLGTPSSRANAASAPAKPQDVLRNALKGLLK